jgi:hypothetical protein
LDFETSSQFDLSIEVNDNAPNETALTASALVSIALRDVNEAPVPVWVPQFLTVSENSPLETVAAAQDGTSTVATDVDVGDTLTFTLLTPSNFSMSAATGLVTVSNAVLDYESKSLYSLTARVTDSKGAVTIRVQDENDAPRFRGATLSVSEGQSAGTLIGGRLTQHVSDDDVNEVFAWHILAGNDDGAFALESTTGQLSQAAPALDFETRTQYVLTVQVTGSDHGGLTDNNTVLVNVLNVNDVTITGFLGNTTFATVGGEFVTLVGTNFGPVGGTTVASFIVTYGGGTGGLYTARDCVVVGESNTNLRCVTAAGSGAALLWRVAVFSAGIPGDSTVSASPVTAGYLPPTVLSLSESTNSLQTVVSASRSRDYRNPMHTQRRD